MIVPQFWAEARLQDRVARKQVTVRRFGWSDSSQEEAQAQAEVRAKEAFARIASGERIVRREPKKSYNGAKGVPIREEIISRHETAVITRNIYGARCLNTPDVLFADVDFEDIPSIRFFIMVIVISAITVGWHLRSLGWGTLITGVLVALPIGYWLATALHRLLLWMRDGAERYARNRIERFVKTHPDWHLRLYRTPAGFRVLAMHRTFDPGEAAVAECLHALGTDPIYTRMCLNQHCFRARVSPKPWRIGIAAHMKPRPGVWPIKPEKLPERMRWVEAYEQAARSYSSCRFAEALGSKTVNPSARAVQIVHDELSQSSLMLPIA